VSSAPPEVYFILATLCKENGKSWYLLIRKEFCQ